MAGGINPFVYSLNNPINYIDPFGLEYSKWDTTSFDIDYGGIGGWAPPPTPKIIIPSNLGATAFLNNFEFSNEKNGCRYMCWSITTDLIGVGTQKNLYTPTKGSPISFQFGFGKYGGGNIDVGGLYHNGQLNGPNLAGSGGWSFGSPIGASFRMVCFKLTDNDKNGCPCSESSNQSFFGTN